MRIAFATRAYWPSIGGLERVAQELAHSLTAAGHDVTLHVQRVDDGPHTKYTHILREGPVFDEFDDGGARVRQVRLTQRERVLALPSAALQLPLVARAGRGASARWYAAVPGRRLGDSVAAGADVVHVLGGDLLAAAAVAGARRAAVPAVVSPFAHEGEWGDDAGSAWAYRRADAVAATTGTDAALYERLGVPRDRVHVIGLPTRALGEAAPADGAPLVVPDDGAPLVVFLGARRANKGVALLEAAAPEVWRTLPGARFAFVGPGPPLALRDERVIDVGAVDEPERADWLRRATVLCLPSASESFGLVVTEAWSVGTPVVVSDIPVLRELVDGSGGGLLAERRPDALAAALVELLADPQRARGMGAAGRAVWYERFRPEAVTERLLGIYRALSSSS